MHQFKHNSPWEFLVCLERLDSLVSGFFVLACLEKKIQKQANRSVCLEQVKEMKSTSCQVLCVSRKPLLWTVLAMGAFFAWIDLLKLSLSAAGQAPLALDRRRRLVASREIVVWHRWRWQENL